MIISVSAKEEIYTTLISVNHEFRDWFDETTCYCAWLQKQSWCSSYTRGSVMSGQEQVIETEVRPVAEKIGYI